MSKIEETSLPGVGVRHDFVTRSGERLGVISHHGGRRDLLVYNRRDPDACAAVVRLEEEDSDTLAELLGGSQITERLTNLQQTVQGLTLDWLPISESWGCAGRTMQEAGLQLRKDTGVSIVAVVRDGQTIPTPSLDFRLLPGDTVVVVGTPQAIREAAAAMQSGGG